MTQIRRAAIFVAAVFQYITLYALDGREIHINTAQITGIGAPKDEKLFSGQTNCIVHMTDGKFISVKEECADLKKRIEGLKK